MRFRPADLPPHEWAPPQTLQIPDSCGGRTEYLPSDGRGVMRALRYRRGTL